MNEEGFLMTVEKELIDVSNDLDQAGLVWNPEIGDEVVDRAQLERISILVDPLGLTPDELRESYLWLPTVEQMVYQFEARQAFLYHAGVTNSLSYEAVIKSSSGIIEATAHSLRVAIGQALTELLTHSVTDSIH